MKNSFSGLPIRLRLSLIFTALLLALLLALGFSLYFIVSQTLNGRLEGELRNETEQLLDHDGHYPGSSLILPGRLLNEKTNEPLVTSDGSPQIQTTLKIDENRLTDSLLLYHPDGSLLADPPGGTQSNRALVEAALAARGLPGGQGLFRRVAAVSSSSIDNAPTQLLAYGRPVYGLSVPENEQSALTVLAILVDTVPYEETGTLLDTMGGVLLVSLPAALIISLLLGSLVAGRALQPIKAITETARQIGATDLNRRIGLTTRDELGQLASTFDMMIERLQASFSRQRRFVADASHELRTPLSVIEAEATLMLKRPREIEDYQHALELITDEAGRLKNLIDAMLTLARADSGEQLSGFRLLALDDRVIEAVERISLLANQKNQRIQLELDTAEEFWVNGDPEVLDSLFFNLLSNAVKYTQEGGQLRVTLRRGGKLEAVFEVADNGPGITLEHLPYLFDRFYRADRARTRTGSSGLGLAIAQWAAEVHGGRIAVQSVPGQGTTFSVFLPLQEVKK